MSTSSTLPHEAVAASPRPHARSGPVVVAAGEGDHGALFQAARMVAARLDRGVRVISVVPPLLDPGLEGAPMYVPPVVEAERELRDGLAQLLEREIRHVAGDAHSWEWEIVSGDAASTLVRRATDLDAPIVVMGIGRHRPIDRLLAAETTLRVIRHATTPVLAVGTAFEAPPKRMVVATDLGPRSAVAAEAALPLLADGATVHLVHVWEPSGSTNAALLAMEQRYESSLPARFQRFRAALTIPAGVTVTETALEGKTAASVLRFAERVDADLVVAGRQGLNVLARLVVGSVTTTLVRAAACAVLVVPDSSFPELDRMQRALTGTSESHDPSHWSVQLEAFTRRNVGRLADLEVDDPDLGAQTQERGYALLGAAYDPHDGRVELMLGSSREGGAHLSRGIRGVESVSVLCDDEARDLGLSIRHGRGQTILLFGPDT